MPLIYFCDILLFFPNGNQFSPSRRIITARTLPSVSVCTGGRVLCFMEIVIIALRGAKSYSNKLGWIP